MYIKAYSQQLLARDWQLSCEREVYNDHDENAVAVIPNDLIKSQIVGHAPFKYRAVKNLNKLVNRDMKHLNNWLSANISLNMEITELVIFKSPRKVLPDEIKIKLSGKILYPSNSLKYLGVRIDRHWHDQVNSTGVKTNRANALLLKIRNYVNNLTLQYLTPT